MGTPTEADVLRGCLQLLALRGVMAWRVNSGALRVQRNGRWIDPDRSRELIGKSLLILEALLERDARLREAIHGNAA